ncbi:MAG: hypothetical protein Q7S85_00850 [Rugosibacter sp.]|nr:hypothetical protein [Rugosibacter sp.]
MSQNLKRALLRERPFFSSKKQGSKEKTENRRGNNRRVYFSAADDYHRHPDGLAGFAPRCGCQLHAPVC